MRDTLALLLADGYKHVHAEQYPKNTTRLVSYLTPRKSRLQSQDKMILFGLQAFCKKYLIEYFNENFFNVPLDEVISEYTSTLNAMLGQGNYRLEKVINLHKLGYLPIEIWALPEGTAVPMHVPCIEVTSTNKDFAWVTQWVESLLSSEIWKPCIHANVGRSYREIVNKYYDKTVEDNVPRSKAMSDFGFRGMSCLQEATKASAAWLLSFSGTATIPAVPYIERYYNASNEDSHIATNAISTEHSVMASNFAVDGNEISFIRRLLNEVYPHASFSMVSDTYDYWNIVDNILPQLKDEILNHDGKMLVRPDSGDIIEISVETVKHLWNIFGGTVNSKGYKVLDTHIGCVYGDGVTQERAEKIYSLLESEGFASNNIVFGAGSFSFNCIAEDGVLNPYTRDTFSVAIKACGGTVDSRNIPIFKDPKTDRDENGGGFKKSQKGWCRVFYEDGVLTYKDEYLEPQHNYGIHGFNKEQDAMIKVFKDGEMIIEQTFDEIRERVNNGKF